MSVIFSCKGGPFHIDCQFFEPYQNSSSAHSDSLSNSESLPSLCEAYWLKTFSLGLIFFLFSESLLSTYRFWPVLDVTLTGDWSSLTGERDNSLTGDLRCSLTGDMFSLTGDVGPFIGDVNFLCFLWDWWELYLPFLLFIIRKSTLLSWRWLYSSSKKIHMKMSENHKKGNKYLSSIWFS